MSYFRIDEEGVWECDSLGIWHKISFYLPTQEERENLAKNFDRMMLNFMQETAPRSVTANEDVL